MDHRDLSFGVCSGNLEQDVNLLGAAVRERIPLLNRGSKLRLILDVHFSNDYTKRYFFLQHPIPFHLDALIEKLILIVKTAILEEEENAACKYVHLEGGRIIFYHEKKSSWQDNPYEPVHL